MPYAECPTAVTKQVLIRRQLGTGVYSHTCKLWFKADHFNAALERGCLFLQMHTTAPTSRDFGRFKQQMLLQFGSIINKHGAKLALPSQVSYLLIAVSSTG